MKDATFTLRKHRVYTCRCGATPCRPLQASDTIYSTFPKPCDCCGASLDDAQFTIVDTDMFFRELEGR